MKKKRKKNRNSNRWKTWKTEKKIRNQGYKPMSEKENLEKSWKIPYKNCRKWYKKCNTLIKKSPCFGWWSDSSWSGGDKEGEDCFPQPASNSANLWTGLLQRQDLASTYRQRQCHGSTKVVWVLYVVSYYAQGKDIYNFIQIMLFFISWGFRPFRASKVFSNDTSIFWNSSRSTIC